MNNENKPSVLYVDDEDINLIIFESNFKDNFNLHCTSSGEQALKILQNKDIDVIVTDQRMPIMTGVEMLKKSLAINADLGRIVLSGYTDAETIIDAVNNGKIDAYLTKPWDIDHLKSIINDSYSKVMQIRDMYSKINELKAQVKSLTAN